MRLAAWASSNSQELVYPIKKYINGEEELDYSQFEVGVFVPDNSNKTPL